MSTIDRALLAFADQFEAVIVVEWNANEHPAALISTEVLVRSAAKLSSIYRDGFWLVDPTLGRALVVSFDDDRAEVEIANFELPYRRDEPEPMFAFHP